MLLKLNIDKELYKTLNEKHLNTDLEETFEEYLVSQLIGCLGLIKEDKEHTTFDFKETKYSYEIGIKIYG
jgi:hypothetical protein